jgi:hypothetical protein
VTYRVTLAPSAARQLRHIQKFFFDLLDDPEVGRTARASVRLVGEP